MNKEEKLKLIQSNEKLASRLSDSFSKEFESDDEKPSRRGRYMAKAILEKDFEGLLIAICGWSSDSLINMAIYDNPYPEEETTPRVITREMVEKCYKNGKISLAANSKEWIGVACEIGDLDWFYIGDSKDIKTVKDFKKKYSEDFIISLITMEVNDIDEDDEYFEYLSEACKEEE